MHLSDVIRGEIRKKKSTNKIFLLLYVSVQIEVSANIDKKLYMVVTAKNNF